jgi:hypothetical protein
MKAICMTVDETLEKIKEQIPYGQDGSARTQDSRYNMLRKKWAQ